MVLVVLKNSVALSNPNKHQMYLSVGGSYDQHDWTRTPDMVSVGGQCNIDLPRIRTEARDTEILHQEAQTAVGNRVPLKQASKAAIRERDEVKVRLG